MKKIVVLITISVFVIGLISSCRTHESCPAYKNGSAQKAAVIVSDRV